MANNENLKPYQPGKSGNPKGRGKGVENSATRLQRIFKLKSKIKNPVTGKEEWFTVLELMDLAQVNAARKGNTLAYRELLDRYEGKSVQAIAMTNREGEDIVTPFSDSQVDRILKELNETP